MSALQIVVDDYAIGYENSPEIVACAKEATTELAQLRAADIRTMEHCDVCGSLLAPDADAPEDVEPFCPYCEYQEAIIMIFEHEKTIESLRADLQAAQEIIESCASLDRYVSDSGIEDARAWLAANPAPQERVTLWNVVTGETVEVYE